LEKEIYELVYEAARFLRSLSTTVCPNQQGPLLKGLPPLTILVVQERTGLPGVGFSAASAEAYAKEQMRVFDYDWLRHGAPNPEELAKAVQKRPSRLHLQ
jgi:hypothetical protein